MIGTGRWLPAQSRVSLRLLAVVAGAGLVMALNLWLAGRSIGLILDGAPAVDWQQIVSATQRVSSGGLYEVSEVYAFPYSPLLAYLMTPLAGIGALPWRLIHVAAALSMPTWPMRVAMLISWPFWFDVETGNLLVFVVLAAAWAIRGNRFAIGAFLLMTILVPRPLMLPVAAWLVWQFPGWRVPAAVMVVVAGVLVAVSGWGDDWIGFLASIGSDFDSPNNLGPTRLLGAAWLLIGMPLALWLTRRGNLGGASVAVSYPYVLPYYLAMLVLEVPRAVAWFRRSLTREAAA